MDTLSARVQFLAGTRAGGFPLKCQGGVSPQQGRRPSVCSCGGNCGVFLFSFSLSSSFFFFRYGKGSLVSQLSLCGVVLQRVTENVLCK